MKNMTKCVFLDRDGVINKDRPEYVYESQFLHILDGVPEALSILKKHGFLLVVVTNQSGIDRGIFTEHEVHKIHELIQEATGHLIDAFMYSPYHRTITNSLSAKPDSLLFEKALSKYKINPRESWMVGDRFRDLIPAEKLEIRTVLLHNDYGEQRAHGMAKNLLDAVRTYIIPTEPYEELG